MALWTAGETVSRDKFNQKTVYVGAAEPATMFAGMIWFDLDDNVMKVRNKDNNGWVTLTIVASTLGVGYITNLG